MIGVAVVGAPNAQDSVPKASLGVVGITPCPAHQRPRSAAQVVQPPVGHTALLVEILLELVETADRLLVPRREEERVVLDPLGLAKQIAGRLRKRHDMIKLGLVTTGRDNPIVPG